MQLSQCKTGAERREYYRGARKKYRDGQITLLGRDGWRAKCRASEKATRERTGRRKRKNVKAGLCGHARARGREKGLPATITPADIYWPARCPILGTELNYEMPRGLREDVPAENRPSLDRMKPELGYVPGNVYVISHRANTLKGMGTAAELRKVLAYMELYDAT